jgi:hypothetical protein
MGLLNRDLLLKKQDLAIEQVDLGNEEFVFVREMTGHERDIFEQSLVKENKNVKGGIEKSLEDFRGKLAVCTVCDGGGKLLLSPSDAALLSKNMGAKKLEKIINVAQKLNLISEEDKEALVKNSVVGQADNSISDSVEN